MYSPIPIPQLLSVESSRSSYVRCMNNWIKSTVPRAREQLTRSNTYGGRGLSASPLNYRQLHRANMVCVQTARPLNEYITPAHAYLVYGALAISRMRSQCMCTIIMICWWGTLIASSTAACHQRDLPFTTVRHARAACATYRLTATPGKLLKAPAAKYVLATHDR